MIRRVDLGKVFALNDTLDVEVEYVGLEKAPVVTIKGFYKRPHLVRRFVSETPAPNFKHSPGSRNFKDFYWCRQSLNLGGEFNGVVDAVCAIIRRVYDLEVESPASFTTNVFQLRKAAPDNVRALPHQDFLLLSADEFARHPPTKVDAFNAVVYLNTAKEAKGGTALYRDRRSGMESVPLSPEKYREYCEHILKVGNFEDGFSFWHQKQSETWEVHHLCPMVFNNLVIFPSSLFHSPWHMPDWFVGYPRVTQALFLTGAKRAA